MNFRIVFNGISGLSLLNYMFFEIIMSYGKLKKWLKLEHRTETGQSGAWD